MDCAETTAIDDCAAWKAVVKLMSCVLLCPVCAIYAGALFRKSVLLLLEGHQNVEHVRAGLKHFGIGLIGMLRHDHIGQFAGQIDRR